MRKTAAAPGVPAYHRSSPDVHFRVEIIEPLDEEELVMLSINSRRDFMPFVKLKSK
jgi:hypothetical protein